jgi:hypothetical protein
MVAADYQEFANRPTFRIVTIARFGTTTRLSLAKFSPALRDCHVRQAETPRKRNFSESIAAQSPVAPSWAESTGRPVSAHRRTLPDTPKPFNYQALHYEASY